MARPRKNPAERRTEQVNIPLSPLELAQLQEQAAAAKMTVTAFARMAALGAPIKVMKTTAPDFVVRDEMRRIGVNLNQIAKALNSRQDGLPASLVSACQRLDTLFDQWLDDGSQDRQLG